MSAAERWLEERLSTAPPRLLATMRSALAADTGDVPAAFAEAAVRLYAELLEGSGGREDALDLLAADALLTHAFEALAELHPEALPGFAERWGSAGRLGALAARLPASVPRPST